MEIIYKLKFRTMAITNPALQEVTYETTYTSPKGLQINCVKLTPSNTVALQFVGRRQRQCIHAEGNRVNEAHISLIPETALAIALTILKLLDDGFGINGENMPIPSGEFSSYVAPTEVIVSDGGDEVESIVENK